MEKKKYKVEEVGLYPKITVMQPSVVNVDNVPSENVVSLQESENEKNIHKMLTEFRDWDREWSNYGKIQWTRKPMSSFEFVELLSKKYTVSLVKTAEETPIDDVNLDYQNPDGK